MGGKREIPLAQSLDPWLKSDIYLQNVDFWQRAWNMVKVPYTQMPDLPYLASLPEKLAPSKEILDLGCGSGWLSIYLARQGFNLTGIDIANHAIELACKWAQDEGLSIKFDTGDIAHLDYQPGSFEVVLANSIFEHLPRPLAQRTIEQIHNLLRPNGRLFACFDKVGTGPGQYYTLDDDTHVYTDKGRQGMLLRNYEDQEIVDLLYDLKENGGWQISSFETLESGSRIVWAKRKD